MNAPQPQVVVAVSPLLLAEALGQVLRRQHGGTVSKSSPGGAALEVVTLEREPALHGRYVLRLPDGTGQPAVLLTPDGRSTTLVLSSVAEISDLVGDLLRRD
jgi:hypothetical protein